MTIKKKNGETRAIIKQLLIDNPGIRQKEIAKRLGLSYGPVSQHIRNLRRERERVTEPNKYPDVTMVPNKKIIQDLFDEVKELKEKLEAQSPTMQHEAKEQPKWSADGIAFKPNKKEKVHYIDNTSRGINDIIYDPDRDFCAFLLSRGQKFQTEERAQLELDRQKAQYIMRKMACESREDNDWRAEEDGCDLYRIYWGIHTQKLNVHQESLYIFNSIWFKDEASAQVCINLLMKIFGLPSLKKIWGIK